MSLLPEKCGEILEPEILDLLTSLVDKSMATYDESTGRYRMLESVRQYSRDRLVDFCEAERLRDRHLFHFLVLAEEVEPDLTGPDQGVGLERLEGEHDNLRAALAWSFDAATETAFGLRLASALWLFWQTRGYVDEGRAWYAAALRSNPDTQNAADRANALIRAGNLAKQQCDFASAHELYQVGLGIRRELADNPGIASALHNLGYLQYERGDYSSAGSLAEQSLSIRQDIGDQHGMADSLYFLADLANVQGDPMLARKLAEGSVDTYRKLGHQRGIAQSLIILGNATGDQGEFSLSRSFYEQALEILRPLGDQYGLSVCLGNLGLVAGWQGDFKAARSYYKEGVRISLKLNDRKNIAYSLEGLAAVAAYLGDPARAARAWGASERLREEIGCPLPPSDRPRHTRQVAEARASLGDDAAFDVAWQEGRGMAMESAIEYALQEPSNA